MSPILIPTFHSTPKRTDDNRKDLSPALNIISNTIITKIDNYSSCLLKILIDNI